MPKDISQQNFEEEITNSQGITIVDFWASWCPPCRALDPILEDVEKDTDDSVKVVKLNVDENQQIAMQHGIRGIPTVKIFKDGKEVETLVGLVPKSHYIDLIKKYS